jgi:hypothetical protein
MNQALPYLVCTLSGTLLGALIAWLLTHVYARQALREARREREAAQHYTRSLITLLKNWENQGRVVLSRDEHGEITGGQIVLEGGAAPAQR